MRGYEHGENNYYSTNWCYEDQRENDKVKRSTEKTKLSSLTQGLKLRLSCHDDPVIEHR